VAPSNRSRTHRLVGARQPRRPTPSLRLHVRQACVHLRQADTHLVSCLFESGIYFTGRGGVQLGKMRVETCLLGKVILPYVSLENRGEGCGIVASNLYIHYINMLEENRGEMYRISRSTKRMVMCEGIGPVICRRKSSRPRTLPEVFAAADGVNNSSSPSS
jgi:hypothetical protein